MKIKKRYMIAEEGGSTPFNLSNMGKVISNISNWKENLSENLYPRSYTGPSGGSPGMRGTLTRIFNAAVLDQAEEGANYEGSNLIGRERQDLLNMVMGQDQKFNTINESQYRPTETKTDDSDVTYYTSKQTEDGIKKILKKNKWRTKYGSDNLIKAIKDNYDYSESLGYLTIDSGKDDKGEYISYYDKWNLNPTDIHELDSTIDKTLGLNSPELYGRVYLDELKEKEKDSKNITKKKDKSVKINKKEKDEG